MRNSVIAFFLSACTVATIAHEAPTAPSHEPYVQATPVRPAAARAASARPTVQLITEAGAVTRDGSPGAQASSVQSKTESGKLHHTSSAMLLAALALMLAIAVRRFSARDQ